MESLLFQNTEDTPFVECNTQTGIISISGRSLPENAIDFYLPILEWIDSVMSSAERQKFVVEIKLEYFNTASSKQIAKMLLIVEKYVEKHDLLVRWYYEKEDQDMLMSGNQYSKFLKIPFEIIEM